MMKIYFEQIPDECRIEDYPDGTEFILDDTPVKIDMTTGRPIRSKSRPWVYPNGDIKEK